MKDLDLTVREIDDLLEHLYNRLKGKKEGLSLIEPAVIILSMLRMTNSQVYSIHLPRFSPVIVDALISRAYVSFGFEGLESLALVAPDISIVSGDYTMDGVDEGLEAIRLEIVRIHGILGGKAAGKDRIESIAAAGPENGYGFFREHIWGSADLPLVSIYKTGRSPFTTGRVVHPRVELRLTGEWSVRRSFRPVVSFKHISAEPNSPFEDQVHTALAVAENFAASSLKIRDIFRIPREYTISLPEIASLPPSAVGIMTGGSAGLALCALMISLLSMLDLSGRRYTIRPGTAFTGTLDWEGNVHPVEDSLIGEKVRAVFFSTSERFVLPRENLASAETALAVLAGEYPQRKLELLPVSTVEEACLDRRIAETKRTPAGKPFLQRVFHWRKHLVASVSAVVAAFVAIFVLPPYLDRTIANVGIVDSLIVISNRSDHQLTTYNLGFIATNTTRNSCRQFAFSDLDGDGADELICAVVESFDAKSAHMTGNLLHMVLFDNEGRYNRKYVFNDRDIVGNGVDERGWDQNLRMFRWSTLQTGENGEKVLILGMHHSNYAPVTLIRFSPTDDKHQFFLHRGFLQGMAARDFDGDGKIDILLSGYNVDLDFSVAIVLDPNHMNGSSPQGWDYDVPGFDTDIAKYYIKLPEFYKYVQYNSKALPLMTCVVDHPDGPSVFVKSLAEDVKFHFTSNMECDSAIVLQSFTKGKTRPDSVVAVTYDGQHEDELALREAVRYWNGEEWVAQPAMNRSYLEYIARIDSSRTGTDGR